MLTDHLQVWLVYTCFILDTLKPNNQNATAVGRSVPCVKKSKKKPQILMFDHGNFIGLLRPDLGGCTGSKKG